MLSAKKNHDGEDTSETVVNLWDYNVAEEEWTEWGPLDRPSRNLRIDKVCRCGKIGELLVEFRSGRDGYQQERRHFFEHAEARKHCEERKQDDGVNK